MCLRKRLAVMRNVRIVWMPLAGVENRMWEDNRLSSLFSCSTHWLQGREVRESRERERERERERGCRDERGEAMGTGTG